MYIYDGNSTSASLFPNTPFAFSGPNNVRFARYTSSGDCLTVRYTSDNTGGTGFEAIVRCVSETTIDACTGSFTDSGGAGGNYPIQAAEVTTICADNGGSAIVTFSAFALENGFDFLNVYDGADNTATSLGSFTGTNIGTGVFQATGSCLTFEFISDISIADAGWVAAISCTAPPSGDADYTIDDGTQIDACTGIFADSGDTNVDYGDNESFTKTFCSDEDNQIAFTFEHFNVAAGDQLEIFDGPTTGATSLGVFTGFGKDNSPGSITASGQCLTFMFTSNGSGRAPGWEAIISCTGTPDPGATGGSWTGYPGPSCSSGNTEIGGTVYEDVGHDGQRGARDFGVGGVTVTLFDDSGMVGSPVTTDVDGGYIFSGLMAGTIYRVEFTVPDNLTEGPYGAQSGTAVQFVESGTCSVNLGLVDAAHYCDGVDPFWTTPCYVNGDPSHISNVNSTGIAGFSYSDSGDQPSLTFTNYITTGAIGSTWGTAFEPESSTLYMTSVLKRHVGIGPGGIGAIYSHVDGTANTVAPVFYDFGALAGSIPDNNARFPGTGTGFGDDGPCGLCNNIDPDVFSQVGKVGFGDIEIDPENANMYVTNLYDRKVYRIDINNPTPGSAVPLPAIPWLDNSICDNGVARPWALEFRRGKLFVGLVCDASTSGCVPGAPCSDLTAEVYSFDGSTWANELSVTLDYYREAYSLGSNYMVPWLDNWSEMEPYVSNVTDANFQQPILMSIDFDDDNDIILGLGDRTALQLGYESPPPTGPVSSTAEQTMVFGDILRASYDSATDSYTIESNGVVGDLSTTNPNGASGIDGRSFYWGDFWTGIGANRFQAGVGAVAVLPGSGEVMFTTADPIDYFSNGVTWMSSLNGSETRALEVFQGAADGSIPNFAKGSGLGDISFFCEAAPLEIGNIVWWDENLNGRQDPSELGIPGITLELWYDPTGSAQNNGTLDMGTAVLVAETTTDNLGRYIFSSSNNSNGLSLEDWSFTAADEVLPNTFYQIRIANWETDANLIAFRDGLGYIDHLLSPTQNQGTTGVERDNNAYDSAGDAAGSVATGDFADNDHNFDFAFGGVGGCEAPTVVPGANTPCLGEALDLTAVVSGGVAPYTYAWTGPDDFTSDQQNPTIASATATMDGAVFTLVVTDATACSETVDITPAINTIELSATSTETTCGAADGTIDLTITGSPPYLIDWDNNGLGDTDDPEDLTGLAGGLYTVSVTDGDGCMATTSVGISSVGAPVVAITPVQETCTLGNGSISLNITGASGNITWSTGTNANSTTLSNLSAGTYSVTVNDAANMCPTILSVELTNIPGQTISVTQINDFCGAGNGSIDLSIAGGTPPYSIDWDINGTGDTNDPEDLTDLMAGDYIVVVTDANNCMATETVTITNTTGPGASLTPTNEICSASNGSMLLDVTGGTPPFTYVWNNGLTIEDLTGLGAGTYIVTVTDANGCTATATETITNTAGPAVVSIVPTDATNCTTSDGAIALTISGGTPTFTFAWLHSESGTTYTTEDLTNVPSGMYLVVVTDMNGCEIIASTVVGRANDPALSITTTDPTTCGETGSLELNISGGDGPFTIDWSNDGLGENDDDALISGLGEGNYTAIVTDVNGCITQANASIRTIRDPIITGVITNPSCGGTDGAITLTVSDQDGGGGGLTFDWDNDGVVGDSDPQNLTGLAPGNYTVVLTNSLGCMTTATFSLSAIGGPVLELFATTPTCGGSNGAIDLEVTGGTMPYTFQWDNDGIADNDDVEDLNSLAAGDYKVTVTDNTGCVSAGAITLTTDPLPTLNAIITPTNCAGSEGMLDLQITGIAPFTIDWSHIAGTNDPEDLMNLAIGSYTVTVTDASNCPVVETFEVARVGGCFDLALVKRLDLTANPGPFGPDSTVTFAITVYNQGSADVTDVEVKDYIPEGLSLAPASAPNWTVSVDTAILTTPFDLEAGEDSVLSISFVIDTDFMLDTLTNLAEISSFDDDGNPSTDPPEDEDSTPNDNGMDPAEADTPDEYDDDGDDTPGTMDDPADEDDFDWEGIFVCATRVTVANPFTVCSAKPIPLNNDASITPASLGGTWSTPDGDVGAFTTGTDFATATTYVPTPADAQRGSVTLVLTSNDPAGPCEPVSNQVVIEILQVDCGNFPWGGD